MFEGALVMFWSMLWSVQLVFVNCVLWSKLRNEKRTGGWGNPCNAHQFEGERWRLSSRCTSWLVTLSLHQGVNEQDQRCTVWTLFDDPENRFCHQCVEQIRSFCCIPLVTTPFQSIPQWDKLEFACPFYIRAVFCFFYASSILIKQWINHPMMFFLYSHADLGCFLH